MVSAIVAVVCLLALIALRILQIAIKLTVKSTDLTLSSRRSRVFSTAGKAVSAVGNSLNKSISFVSMGLKGFVALLIPIGLIEIVVSASAFLAIFAGASAYITQVADNAKFTSTTTIQQAKDSVKDGKEGSSNFGAAQFQSTTNPGILDEDWDRASTYAKKTVNTAIAWMDADPLTYSQAPQAGQWDCSAFVTAVINMATEHKFSGAKFDQQYNFKDLFNNRTKINKFGMPEQHYTGSMETLYPQGSKGYIGTLDNDWAKKLVPGDVLLCPGHVKFYLGRRASDKKPMFAESSSPGMTGFSRDLAETKPRTDMGIHTMQIKAPGMGYDTRVYHAVRPYVLMK